MKEAPQNPVVTFIENWNFQKPSSFDNRIPQSGRAWTAAGLVIQPSGDEDNDRSKDECERDLEVEERHGRQERYHDAETRREAFENVVRVLDHHCSH